MSSFHVILKPQRYWSFWLWMVKSS